MFQNVENVMFGSIPEICSIQGCHSTGKTANLKVHFSREGKHRESGKNIKDMFLHRGIYHQHRENFES